MSGLKEIIDPFKSGRLDEDLYPKWKRKESFEWHERIGNLWRICEDWGTLYNVPSPSIGADQTCVIYYISNEQQNPDKDNPIDTLRGVIWAWDEENVQWLPQNLGTALTYTKPTDNKYWNPENFPINSDTLTISIDSNDIPDSGKWSPILQSDVTNAYVSAYVNDIIPPNSFTSTTTRIIPSLNKISDVSSFKYDNLSKNNFADEQIRLAKKLFTAR
jgi:hypothetical protein